MVALRTRLMSAVATCNQKNKIDSRKREVIELLSSDDDDDDDDDVNERFDKAAGLETRLEEAETLNYAFEKTRTNEVSSVLR